MSSDSDGVLVCSDRQSYTTTSLVAKVCLGFYPINVGPTSDIPHHRAVLSVAVAR